MPTARPFTYLAPGLDLPNTIRYGTILVGLNGLDIPGSGLNWFNGPDEDLGYVIAHNGGTGRTYGNNTGPVIGESVGFWRSSTKDEISFLGLANKVTGQGFTSGLDAKNWLESNGYWTSYLSIDTLVVGWDASYDKRSINPYMNSLILLNKM